MPPLRVEEGQAIAAFLEERGWDNYGEGDFYTFIHPEYPGVVIPFHSNYYGVVDFHRLYENWVRKGLADLAEELRDELNG